MTELKRVLGLKDIVFMNVVAIVGLRWLLTASQTGPSATVLWILALVLFFIPQALTVIELTTRYPRQGGLYVWTKLAFGPAHGFVAGWCYWVNNLIYYPSLLIFMASNALYIGGAHWLGMETNPYYMALFSISVLWFVLGINILGLRFGKLIQNIAANGSLLPVVIIIPVGFYALYAYGSATEFTLTNIWPDFLHLDTITFWSTMCFGFAGLELASVLSGEVRDPRRSIPRGIIIAGVVITIVYILGTLGLQFALPTGDIGMLAGIPQAIAALFADTGLSWLGPLTALAIVIAGIGGLSAWMAGAARIPYVSGLDHFLPESLGKVHPRYGTPHVSLIWQGIFSTLFILMSVVGSTIQEAYMVLVDATLILYFIPYVYMFASVIRLRSTDKMPAADGTISIPGGTLGLYAIAGAGMFSTVISIFLAMIPGPDIASPVLFLGKVLGGTAAFLLLGLGLYRYYGGRR